MNNKFYIVDAFSEKVFGGNTAGVVILDSSSEFPEESTMISLAAELKYSETVFILPSNKFAATNNVVTDSKTRKDDFDFHARYFTPTDEVDLCGHATIGGFTALLDAGLVKDGVYRLKTKAETISVEVSENKILMDMASPLHLGTIDNPKILKRLYSIMGTLPPEDSEVSFLKPMLISTGLSDIMLPLASSEELCALNPEMQSLADISKELEVVGVHAFTMDYNDEFKGKKSIQARNFAPLFGINEEAATGTSNGALAYYLYLNGLISDSAVCNVVQGETMNRPSIINVSLSKTSVQGKKSIMIKVGGQGVILAKGQVNL
ncbi:PhzF family phenazine biosynthesis protein [Eubacteriales bacterium KG127]